MSGHGRNRLEVRPANHDLINKLWKDVKMQLYAPFLPLAARTSEHETELAPLPTARLAAARDRLHAVETVRALHRRDLSAQIPSFETVISELAAFHCCSDNRS